MTLSRHSTYMNEALSLAGKGRGQVNPNPMVGAVIVRQGRVVGRGWHKAFGGPHAEVNAIKNAGAKAKGGTLYINLEPCSHQGKTPPCAPAVIKAGLKEVYVAMKDPNPKVQGRGLTQLKKAGIRVHVGLEKDAAQELNKPFITLMTQKRPTVLLKLASSLDGKIATKTGDSKWISSQECRSMGHELRAQSDAILIGVNTALQDNPSLTSHGKGRNPLRIVLDPQLRIKESLQLIKQDPKRTLIITSDTFSATKAQRLSSMGVRLAFLPLKNGKIEVRIILNYLAKISISQLLVEGGSETAGLFLDAKLVDELFLFVAPVLVGGRTGLTSVGGDGVAKISQALQLKSYHTLPIGRDILVHGTF